MNVVFSHDWLTGMRGGEKVLEAMARLFPDAGIYTLVHKKGSLSRELEARTIHTSFLQNWPGAATHYKYYLPFFPSAIESLKVDRADLVISSSHCAAGAAASTAWSSAPCMRVVALLIIPMVLSG